MAFPYLMGSLMGASTKPQESFHILDMENMQAIVLLLLIVFAAQAIFSFLRIYFGSIVVENAMNDLRQDTYARLVTMPMDFFNRNKVGELTSRTSSDISLLQETLSVTIGEFIRQIITILITIFVLAFISIKLSLIMLATIPVMAIIAVFFGRFIKKLSKQTQDKLAASNSIIEESLTGIVNVKAYANEFLEFARYGKTTEEVKNISLKASVWRGLFVSFIIFFMFGAIAFVVWRGAVLVENGELTTEHLASFIFYTLLIGASFGSVPEFWAKIQKTVGGTERLMDLLDENGEAVSIKNAAKKINVKGEVEFKNVGFYYATRPDADVLKDVSFHVSPGEQVAFVGSSGSGKSTLVSLLLQFYRPVSGKILFDGNDAGTYDISELRSQMALVPQEVILFGGTIRENISYGKANATDEEILEAARKANAYDFIMQFPEKLDTLVGDRGIQLSGGQKQRVAIARAVLRDPAILLLDEATSSLDSESERLVQDALEKLMKGRTTFVIAHRLSTIRNADKIIVLDKGEIKQTGTHAELMQVNDGIYKKLNTLQFID